VRARSPIRRSSVRVLAVGTLIVVALVATGCTTTTARRAGESVIEHATDDTFYVVPNPLPPAAPGTLIRSERLLGAPNGAIAWRVLYHSRDVFGHDIAVSGVVVAPNRDAPHNGWPVVAWAHPTTGTAQKCAPSKGLDPFDVIEGLRALIDDGYVVAATDYSGMGASGPPAYLVGTTEGNNTLDSVRAARQIADAHASSEFLLWGHSQGGQAALFAAQDARSYAPELHLLGVAVAAPAVKLDALLRDDIVDDLGVELGAYAFDAYLKVYGPTHPTATMSSFVTPAGIAAIPKLVTYCSLNPLQTRDLDRIAKPLVGHFLTADPGTIEPWKTWLAENTPGGRPIDVPIFIAQGTDDHTVRPPTTNAYVAELCAAGATVEYVALPGTGHALAALKALPKVQPWLHDRAADRPAPNNCAQHPFGVARQRASSAPSASSVSTIVSASTGSARIWRDFAKPHTPAPSAATAPSAMA
jgi:pimeloyl-ACP methyl ester carboxylesterase